MLGAQPENYQEIFDATSEVIEELYKEACSFCEPDEPTFDEMAQVFTDMNLGLTLTQEAFDQMKTLEDEADDFMDQVG